MPERFDDAAADDGLFRGLLESAPDAMVIVDEQAEIVFVNAQTERLFGYEREDMLGRPIEFLMPERFHALHVGHRGGFLRSPSMRPMGAELEPCGLRADGTAFPVDVSLSPLRTEAGLLVVASVRDATTHKRIEGEVWRLAVEADRANAAKSEFLSRMSHELRTPLNAILGFGQLLQLEDLPDAQRESVEHILSGGRHLLSLINEVLDISQIESGQSSPSVTPVLLHEVVEEAVQIVTPLADARRVKLRVEAPAGDSAYVMSDQQHLLQIVLNLVSNAIKYNHARGSVAIAWERREDRVLLTVTDDGPGISPDEVAAIFSPFERGAARLGAIEGTGLGLSVVNALVTAMGGTVGVDSRLGQGSTFWVELPAGEALPVPSL
jgi:PAS domain S-box-containing protein